MISNSEFEKLWFLYKTEAAPKGVSINAFCVFCGTLIKKIWKYQIFFLYLHPKYKGN